MNREILRRIGLTEGEIKVYEALALLGKSSTGPITEKSKISSSKVYPILERLIQKGFVSFVIENNVKKFQIANPHNILEYINKQQEELEIVKKESESFVKELSHILGSYEEESAQVYKGFAGMRVAFDNLLEDIGDGGEFLFFSQSSEELSNEKVVDFFKKLHMKRLEKNIIARGIADSSLRSLFKKNYLKQKKYAVIFYDLALPLAISIGKSRVLLNIWGDNPICFEVVSHRIAQRYKDFFNKLWKIAKK